MPMIASRADYECKSLQLPIAAKHHVSILTVDHTRKTDSVDPLETISGSFGLSGGVDGVMVITRKRGSSEAVMYVTGRDIIDDREYAMSFDNESMQWVLLDESPTKFKLSHKERLVYEAIEQLPNPTGKDIFLALNPGMSAKGSPKDWNAFKMLLSRLKGKEVIENTQKGYVIVG